MGLYQPNISAHHKRNSPKLNAWCSLLHDDVEKMINGDLYRDVLELNFISTVGTVKAKYFISAEHDTSEWAFPVLKLLDRVFPERWIGRRMQNNLGFRITQPNSAGFLFVGVCCKGVVYQAPVSDISVSKGSIQLEIITVT
ncbi:hypothetical protein AVEN_170045-1 [Araneus ventricosus]|uniref:Uncharacterized protein n=1 Tax=Araneus ventricosus TaxID=182803 RepID=A0A4Y2HMQ3_ARAVE|nr:hypothetical protein AVEN_170045-1 [Araneus ventricosus]